MNQPTLEGSLARWIVVQCAQRRRSPLHPLVVAGLAFVSVASSIQPALADPIDDIIQEQMAASHLPGVAVAIVDNGRVTKLAGYGQANIEWSQRVDPDTRFQLASATKLFTAIVLMRQVERGSLGLDDPIAKFFDAAPESWARITVRQLANHSSGLSENLGKPAPKTVEEAVAASMLQPLAYEPGAKSQYGFTDFTVLRAILEKVGKASLPKLIDREIVKPLGLTSTSFQMADDDGEVRTGDVLLHRASIYGWNGDHQRTSDFFFSALGYGAGGLFSSARDLSKLFVAIDQGKVLKPESLKEITTPATLKSGQTSGFGIGWTVRSYRGVPVVGHSGGPALADILRIPGERRTIVVLTNQQIFFPVLAERVADLSLPAPGILPIADSQPQIARNILTFFNAVADGTATAIAGPSRPDEVLRSGFGKALIDAVGPIQQATLVRLEPSGGRTYRLKFARKVMDWTFDLDDQGRILALRPAN